MNIIEVKEIAYHRNGVSGEGFHIVSFLYNEMKNANMVAVVFENKGHVAVFNRDLLGQGIIKFAENSWRGDVFEYALRLAIKNWNKEGEKDD